VASSAAVRRRRANVVSQRRESSYAVSGTKPAMHDSVTMPRQILPGQTLMLTRRSQDRRYLFRPDPAMNQIFLYLLALFATRFNMVVTAAILMATHPHIIVTDLDGRLPEFLMHFNRMMVLATRKLRGFAGAVWDKRKPSVVELLTPQAIVERTAYVITNPVSDGLLAFAAQWPGVTVRPDAPGGHVLEVARPSIFNKRWPATAELRVGWPPALLAIHTEEELNRQLAQEIHQIEQTAAADAKLARRPFLGPRRIAACSPFRLASTPEPSNLRNPTFAVGRGQRAAYAFAVQARRAYRLAYAASLARWHSGDRDTAFPHGTWWMARFHKAAIGPPMPVLDPLAA
jgi:hypothetical protein